MNKKFVYQVGNNKKVTLFTVQNKVFKPTVTLSQDFNASILVFIYVYVALVHCVGTLQLLLNRNMSKFSLVFN